MPGGINTLNPVANGVPVTLSDAKYSIDKNGQSLSTGFDADNDVVSLSIGNSLQDSVSIYNAISTNLPYGTNLLNTGYSALDSMAQELNKALGVTAQAATPNQQDVITLNTILQNNLQQVARITNNTEFNGKKVLSGDLSGDSLVKPKFDTNPFSVINPAVVNNQGFKDGGTLGVATLTAVAVLAGDVARLGDKAFVAVAQGTEPKENEFAIGANDDETARNLASAMSFYATEAMQKYTIDVAANVVSVTQITNSPDPIPLAGVAVRLAPNLNATPRVANAVDLSGLTTVTGFLGRLNVAFNMEQQDTSLNAKHIAVNNGSIAAIADNNVPAATDQVAVYSVTIGGKVFRGALFMRNGGNLNNAQLKMINQETSEYFIVNADAGYTGAINNGPNATTIATSLGVLFANSTFYQTKTLKIDTSAGNILRNGVAIGSLNGLKASLKDTDFVDRKIEDFKVEAGNNPNTVKFTVTISGVDYTADNLDPADLVKGFKLNLANAGDANAVFSLNLGDYGLTSLNNAQNYQSVASAIKTALKGGEGLSLRTGLDFNDVLKVNVTDLSASQIFVDNAGIYQANLSLLDENSRQQTEAVLKNALQKVRNAQSLIKSQTENVQSAINVVKNATKLTQDSANSYLRTDLVKASAAFSAAVKSILASISTLGAGARVADAAQKIIEQASA